MDLITKLSYDTRTLVTIYLEGMKPNTKRNYKGGIERLLGFLAKLERCPVASSDALLKVDLIVAKAFASTLLKSLSAPSAAVYLAGCCGLYDLIVGQGMLPSNPFRSPLAMIPGKSRAPAKPTPRMSNAEVHKLGRAASCPRDKAILACLFGGGLRRQEVCNLTIDDVHSGGKFVSLKLRETKGAIYSEQSLPDWAGEVVIRFAAERYNTTSGNGQASLFCLSVEGLHKRWKNLCKQAGIAPYGMHSARCTAINRLRELGFSTSEIQDFSRHASVAMVERYIRRTEVPANNPGRRLDYEQFV